MFCLLKIQLETPLTASGQKKKKKNKMPPVGNRCADVYPVACLKKGFASMIIRLCIREVTSLWQMKYGVQALAYSQAVTKAGKRPVLSAHTALP